MQFGGTEIIGEASLQQRTPICPETVGLIASVSRATSGSSHSNAAIA
jgi:hypothetical protein